MSWFDLPYNKFGVYFNPIELFCMCDQDQIILVEKRADELKINHRRWFFSGTHENPKALLMEEKLSPGPVSYFPQYNCLRSYGVLRFEIIDPELLTFEDFLNSLVIHPWNQ